MVCSNLHSRVFWSEFKFVKLTFFLTLSWFDCFCAMCSQGNEKENYTTAEAHLAAA